MRALKDLENLKANLKSINQDLKDPDISDAEKKDLKEKKKDIMKEQKLGVVGKMVGIAAGGGKLKDGKKTDFGMLSVKAGIDKNPKPTQADRIAGATMKDGSRTKVRGVRIANKGFRKARMS